MRRYLLNLSNVLISCSNLQNSREVKPQSYQSCRVSSDKVVGHSTNISLEEIIRENSWFMCEKCDVKAKSQKSLKIQIVKMHFVVSKEELKYAY